jgi:hypothetical protein
MDVTSNERTSTQKPLTVSGRVSKWLGDLEEFLQKVRGADTSSTTSTTTTTGDKTKVGGVGADGLVYDMKQERNPLAWIDRALKDGQFADSPLDKALVLNEIKSQYKRGSLDKSDLLSLRAKYEHGSFMQKGDNLQSVLRDLNFSVDEKQLSGPQRQSVVVSIDGYAVNGAGQRLTATNPIGDLARFSKIQLVSSFQLAPEPLAKNELKLAAIAPKAPVYGS